MLDRLGGLHVEQLDVDVKLLSAFAGRKRANLQSIQEETATNIYYPSFLNGLSGSTEARKAARQKANTVWITGDVFNVRRAREKLSQQTLAKTKSILSREISLLPRKLDWLMVEHPDELKQIMTDNATYIQFPLIGSQMSNVAVFGDQRTNIQRTIRSLMGLTVHQYTGNFWLLPMNFMPPSLIPAQIIPALELISSTTSCDAIYKNNCFEFHGLEPDVTKAVALMMEQDIVRPFGHEIHFQIEMANEHRDFISGKKNGKINKIMQLSNVVIKFETLNDFNFIISVQGNDSTALPGLGFLKEELPAEISFHVPEVYHKRIIGVGGKSIQKIMKKYGTFVKFSNQEEYNAIGGYHDNDDNVLARTPAKNAANLENLRQAIMELVAPKDKDFMTERIDVPRRYHRALLGESSIFIHDIERKSACKVRFPDRELAEDYVDIFGPDAQVHIAAAMLLEHVPFEAEMTVPPSPELPRVINTPHFADFAEGIKRELHVTVVPQLKNGNEQSVFKFRCQRSNADYLSPAKELLESYLLNHNIQIYVTQAHKRADSFADTFSHFNSRVLANPNTKSYMERRIRLANSTPDVKTLLERSVSYVYANQDIKDGDDGGLSARYSNMSLQGGDYVPPPPVTKGRTGLINAPREDDELLKRGSDSLLEAKLREIARQKQQAIRTQSLDLSLVLARIVEGSSDEQTSHFGHYNGAANTGGGEAAQQEEGSDGEYESPSSYVHGGYASASYGKGGGGANGPGVIGSGLSSPTSPLAGGGNAGGSMMTPGSRMSAPVVLPYLGGPRPHAMRMNSGIAEDVIRGLRGNM
ncbi:hypothetical protein FRC18_001880 [Serendipita sp. 400]|nr:hypothetical protein FRC18_001880 [Serendipita sp. 400]